MSVSRETLEERYADLLRQWSPRINLIAKADLDRIEDRHIADCRAFLDFVHPNADWLDIGSGGGLPGIVIAIGAGDALSSLTMVESDRRKATFLRTAIRELGLRAGVRAERAETLPPGIADILSARALASLEALLGHAAHLLRPNGIGLFQKGIGWPEEVDLARETWSFDCDVHPSPTHPGAALLKVWNVRPTNA